MTQERLQFDIHLDDAAYDNAPELAPWKQFALDPRWRGPWLTAGDVNGDGRCELVNALACDHEDVHHTVAVSAYSLDGEVLWRWGDPSQGCNALHSDVACQVYDCDGDGVPEVVAATDTHLVVLDGATGGERERIAIPRHASDCITFARLDGPDEPAVPLVKDRYRTIWALARDGSVRWRFRAPEGQRTAHQPYPVDLDGDGREEIVAGFCALDPDGAVIWSLDGAGIDCRAGHLDCVRAIRLPDGEGRLVLTRCGGDGIACVDFGGRLIWQHTGRHYESVDAGRLRDDVPAPQLVVDITHAKSPYADPLLFLDAEGGLFGRVFGLRVRQHFLADWLGNGFEQVAVPCGDLALVDPPAGAVAGRFLTPQPESLVPVGEVPSRSPAHRLFGEDYLHMGFAGNIAGDGRDDIVLHTNPGTTVWIYRNTRGAATDRPLGNEVNYTLY